MTVGSFGIGIRWANYSQHVALRTLPFDASMVQSFVAMQLPGLVGTDTAHMFPFELQILQECKQADLTRVRDVQERVDRFPLVTGLRSGGGLLVSNDGKVRESCSPYVIVLLAHCIRKIHIHSATHSTPTVL